MEQKTLALTELRSATRALHEQLENALPIAAQDAGRAEYLDYLQDLWGWMSAFEVQLWDAEWPSEMHAARRGGKLSWIEADLRAAGLTQSDIDSLPRAGYLPALHSMPRRFGVAYVIEGAQLGTKVLARSLAPALGDWSPRWLQGYGEQNGGLWRVFMQCAERTLSTPETRREAGAAAADAFASLAAWFEQRQQYRSAPSRAAG